jgi:predicted permease
MVEKILEKIFIYVVILLAGYIGKRLGVFKKEHTKFLNTIICYITLPAAIINGFQNVTLTPILLIGLGVGLFSNILLFFINF